MQPYDTDTFNHQGRTFEVRYHFDDAMGAPWDEADGHGPVSDWTRRDKRAGELILNTDRGSHRYYDFAEACRIARRDGWGFLPGELEHWQAADGLWHARVKARFGAPARFECVNANANAAITGVYQAHRATMTARQYAAGAARADYERLRRWCNDDWHWCGLEVVALDDKRMHASLWGIESDAGAYLDEVARELADEALAQLSALPADA